MRTFEGTLNQSFTADLRESWSNLFLKTDNFGNIRNKCCFQATKSLRAPDLNLVVGRVFTLFPADWRFVITKGGPKISKSPRSEPMAENHWPFTIFGQKLSGRRVLISFSSLILWYKIFNVIGKRLLRARPIPQLKQSTFSGLCCWKQHLLFLLPKVTARLNVCRTRFMGASNFGNQKQQLLFSSNNSLKCCPKCRRASRNFTHVALKNWCLIALF